MYPELLRWISESKLIVDNEGQITYDQTLLEQPIQFDS